LANDDSTCDGVDDNCNGNADEDFVAASCYTGPPNTADVGACKSGTQTCTAGTLDACTGQETPSVEACGDGVDNDCDGDTDEGCSSGGPTCAATYAGCTQANFDANDKTNETGVIEVEIVNSSKPYSPKCIKVKVGQTVQIEATGSHPFKKVCAEDDVMDSQNGDKSNVSFTFATAGYYNYRCKSHSSMKGNIQVVE